MALADITIEIDVVCALPGELRRVRLALPAGTSARAAVHLACAAGLSLQDIGLDPARVALGVFGRHVDDATVLRAHDRLELYRPLQQDPMERRRREAADPRHHEPLTGTTP